MSPLIQRAARFMGVSEGQIYTLAIAALVATVTVATGLPPTFRNASPAVESSVAVPQPTDEPAASDQGQAAIDAAPPPVPAGSAQPPLGAVGRPTVDAPTPPGASPAPTGALRPYADGGPVGSIFAFARVPAPGAAEGIAVTASGEVIVSTNNGANRGRSGTPVILRYSPDGDLLATHRIGAAEGSEYGLLGLAVGHNGAAFALSAEPPAVLRIDLVTGIAERVATIPDLPACVLSPLAELCEPSAIDHPPVPKGLVVGPDGDLYVSDHAQATIWRVDPALSTVDAWHQSYDYLSETGLGGITFDPQGRLVFTVAANPVTNRGAIYGLTIESDGSPGTRRLIAETTEGAAPMGVAVDRGGRIFAALSGRDAVLVINPAGETTVIAPSPDAAVGLDTPVGLTIRGRSLLITNQAPDEASGTVVRISIG